MADNKLVELNDTVFSGQIEATSQSSYAISQLTDIAAVTVDQQELTQVEVKSTGDLVNKPLWFTHQMTLSNGLMVSAEHGLEQLKVNIPRQPWRYFSQLLVNMYLN